MPYVLYFTIIFMTNFAWLVGALIIVAPTLLALIRLITLAYSELDPEDNEPLKTIFHLIAWIVPMLTGFGLNSMAQNSHGRWSDPAAACAAVWGACALWLFINWCVRPKAS